MQKATFEIDFRAKDSLSAVAGSVAQRLQGVAGAAVDASKSVASAIGSSQDVISSAATQSTTVVASCGREMTTAVSGAASAYSQAQKRISEDAAVGAANIKQSISTQKTVIKSLESDLSKMRTKLASAPTAYAKNTYQGKITELKAEIEGERQALQALETTQEQYANNSRRLRTQILDLTDAMYQLRREGKQNTAEYEAMRKKTEELGTAQKVLQRERQALSTGATQWAGAISGLQGLIGAYSVGSGVVSMFIKDEERLSAVQTKMQSVMSVMMGMQQVANTLHATSAFRVTTCRKVTELWTAAQGALASAFGVSTIAARAFMGAVTLGASVLIGAAYSAISKYIDKHREMREEQKRVEKQQQEMYESARKSAASSVGEQIAEYRKLQTSWASLASDMVSKARFVKSNKEAFEKLGVSVVTVRDAENLLVTNEDAFITSMYNRALALAATELAATKCKSAIELMLQASDVKPTDDEKSGANKYASQIYESRLSKASSGVERGQISGNEQAIKSAAYTKYINDAVKARRDSLQKLADEDMKSAEEIIGVANKNNKKVSDALSGAGIVAFSGKTPKGNNSEVSTAQKNAELISQLKQQQVTSDIATKSDGMAKELAVEQNAYDAWYRTAKEGYDRQAALNAKHNVDSTSLTEQFNSTVLAKDTELTARRVEVLKKYSAEAILEYIKQGGDINAAMQATAAQLGQTPKIQVKHEKIDTNITAPSVAEIEVRLKGIEKATSEIERLKQMLSLDGLSTDNRSEIEGTVRDLEGYRKSLGYVSKAQVTTKDKASAASQVVGAFGSVMGSMSGVMNDNAAAWITWGANVLSAVAQAIPVIVSLTTAHTAEAAAGAASSVSSIPWVGPVLAVAAIGSIVAAMASIPKYADGGIAYGATLGVFGEYSGAQNNPEVVAPLDKLRALIAPTAGVGGDVEFRISGRRLVGVLSKESRIKNRTR